MSKGQKFLLGFIVGYVVYKKFLQKPVYNPMVSQSSTDSVQAVVI